ncbi:MAG: KpsF/GutQ family sugar-phosphate isomerase [Ignavibacteria bacterium]|nr:KpsF/GutQ family sugar-phosphate isomerase [Ignavibacteria bacterium]
MNNDIKNAKAVVTKERKAIFTLEKKFSNKDFQKNLKEAIELIYKCKGKVIVTGLGKSGIVAQKLVSTFNSTGTYSMFLHSSDSLHGDLGLIRPEDVVIIISKSGGTSELKRLIPIFKEFHNKIILITANKNSKLAEDADIVLETSITEEACPFNLAPTSSSTVSLVLGDAIAIALLQKKGFTKENFALFHPGGTLGKKLLLKVEDIMKKGDEIPIVNVNEWLKNVIYTISSKRLGCAIVTDKGKIKGIITDGDLRRMLEKNSSIEKIRAKDVMSKNPKVINGNTLAANALEIMERNKITQLIVSNGKNKVDGIIHMHTLVELGLK